MFSCFHHLLDLVFLASLFSCVLFASLVYTASQCSTVLDSCEFLDNMGTKGGGGLHINSESSLDVPTSTFLINHAGEYDFPFFIRFSVRFLSCFSGVLGSTETGCYDVSASDSSHKTSGGAIFASTGLFAVLLSAVPFCPVPFHLPLCAFVVLSWAPCLPHSSSFPPVFSCNDCIRDL